MELEEATIEPMNIGGAYYDDIEFSIKKKKVYYKNQYYNKNTLMLIIHLFFLVTGLIGLVIFVLLFNNWKKINRLRELNERLRQDINDISDENTIIQAQVKEKLDNVNDFSKTVEEYRSKFESKMTEIKEIQNQIDEISREVKKIKKEGRIVQDEIKRLNQLI